ncbi:MAG: cbb3-type cytochrome c oxidase subunit II [Verrucomicrobiota bacterium]
MKTKPLPTFFKVLIGFLLGWSLLVLLPYFQFGRPTLHEDTESGDLLPRALSGLAIRGSHVYEQNRCATCHTQQVRNQFTSDNLKGFGKRRSVSRDFVYQPASVAGINRLGPDLSNVALRQKSEEWHHKHLFIPQSVSPGSIMPSYAFLYEKRKIVGQPSTESLKLPSNYSLEEGYEIVPTADAKALVAYLLSLNQSYSLPEAPIKEE